MTNEEAIKELTHELRVWESECKSVHPMKDALRMAIEALSAKTDGDTISRQDALKPFCIAPNGTRIPEVDCDNFPVEFSVEFIKKHLLSLPSTEPKADEENELKFYYVESLDDYWVGRRLDNFYYATWHEGLGFVWSHSRYLPWGEHIVDKNTLWKEHTYPSEPIEIPFTEWIVGFVKKYFAEPKKGEWEELLPNTYYCANCDRCVVTSEKEIQKYNYCPNCGADMRGEKE